MALILVLTLSACKTEESNIDKYDSVIIENYIFGQKPPAEVPEVFAPGKVSVNGRFEGAISFSPDLEEIYFSASNEDEETAIYFSKLENTKWTPIKKVNFTNGKKKEEMHPFVSPDGKRIYFTALDSAFVDEKIWYVDRVGDFWGNAKLLDAPVNDDLVFFPNQSKNGDLYYFNLSKFKTFYAPHKNGTFAQVEEVPIEFGHHAFIAPSQDYLIVAGRNNTEEGRKDNDLYVCFKETDGTWTKPLDLGKTINTGLNEKSPRITPDGKYLFFGRDERSENGESVDLADIFWVNTAVIERLRRSVRR